MDLCPSMLVLAVGASHRTMDVADLSGFAQRLLRLKTELQERRDACPFPVLELGFLSTCNRVEVYAVPETGRDEEALLEIRRRLFPSLDRTHHAVYELRGTEAVRHLCRVAAGLDSMVVGEPEIAGQVARQFKDSVGTGLGGETLASVAALARKANRRVRSETDLGHHAVSIASVTMDLIKKQIGSLEGREGIVVGAGRVGKLVSTLLGRAGLASLTVVNRSLERRRLLADSLGCNEAPLDDLPKLLREAHIVISATDSPGVILDEGTVAAAVVHRNGNGPLCILDLALPSDVDPKVAELETVSLLGLADVQDRLKQNVALRMQQVGPAEALVEEVVQGYTGPLC